MLILVGGSLGLAGFDAGRRIATRQTGLAEMPVLLLCGAIIGGAFGAIAGWLSAPAVRTYLAWRIWVDEDGFKAITATMPFFVLMFTLLLVPIFAMEGRRIADVWLETKISGARARRLFGLATNLLIALMAAFVGIEFGFDLGSQLAISSFDIFPPLAGEGTNLRWFYILSEATIASLCAFPLAIGGYALGRWPRFALALIGLRLGMHMGELSASRVYDFYNGRVNSFDELLQYYGNGRLVLSCLWGALLAIAGYWSARSVIVACTAAGFAVAAALGAWIGFRIQAFYFNDLEWRVLEEVLFFLLGGLGALAGREVGRWIVALRAGSLRRPTAGEWRTLVAGVLLRIAIAAVGLWLGAEAGYWIALLWDEYASPAPFAYGEVALAWIVAGCAIGGALAVLGYRAGHRAPVAAAFLGALLAFAVAPHLAPLQEHLYWGPFPSSDVHAEFWRRALLVTGMLAAALCVLGYLLARWLRPRATTAAV